MNTSDTRRLWQLLEPYHAAVYFSPEAGEAYGAAGLKGYWMGYFASRSAALGAPGPGVVTALFFNFAPRMVYRALPDAWSFATSERVLAARLSVADAALRRLLGDLVDDAALSEAADLAMQAAQSADVAGRPLFAAHVALPVPQAPHLRLWHAATCLREHRGDGHVAALTAVGLNGCQANVLAVAAGAVPEIQRERRGWSEEEWAAATDSLRRRDWLDGGDRLSGSGVAERDVIEARTDRLAARAFEPLGGDGMARLLTLVEPVARRLHDASAMPYPNPVGVPPAF